jgi:hypothetical protein
MFTVAAAILFALSSGLLFNERFKRNYLLVGITATIAILSSLFLMQELSARIGFGVPAAVRDTPLAEPVSTNPTKMDSARNLAPVDRPSIQPSMADKDIVVPDKSNGDAFATVPYDPVNLAPRTLTDD